MYAIFALPSASSTIADIGTYSLPMGTELLTLLGVLIGFTVAGMALVKFSSVIKGAFARVLGGKRRGRGRRR